MGKMSELHYEIMSLIEQGMTEKFIAVSLKVPLDLVRQVYDERMNLEQLNYYDTVD